MKITINRDVLLQAVDKISQPALVSNTNPILNSFLITAGENSIEIRTSNVIMTANATLKASVEEPGVVCVVAKSFIDFLKGLDNADISLTTTEDKLVMKQKKSKISVNIFNAGEYPKEKEFKGDIKIEEDFDSFKAKLNDVLIASGTNVGYNINGILFEVDKSGNYNLVASDGRRIASIIDTTEERKQFIVPIPLLNILLKCEGKELVILINSKQIQFAVMDTYMTGVLINDKFPDYNKALSVKPVVETTVDREALLKAVKRSAILLKNELNDSIVLDIKKDSISLTKKDERAGEVFDELDAVSTGDLRIGFNPTFLTILLNWIGSKECTLYFVNPSTPMVYKNNNFTYMAAPMRIE